MVRGVIPNTADSKIEILKNFQDFTDRYAANPEEYRRYLMKKGYFVAPELKKAKHMAEEKIIEQAEKVEVYSEKPGLDIFTQLIDGLEWSEPYSD